MCLLYAKHNLIEYLHYCGGSNKAGPRGIHRQTDTHTQSPADKLSGRISRYGVVGVVVGLLDELSLGLNSEVSKAHARPSMCVSLCTAVLPATLITHQSSETVSKPPVKYFLIEATLVVVFHHSNKTETRTAT